MDVPNEQEWMLAFKTTFAELSSTTLPESSYSSFEASHPLIYSFKGFASYRCSKCNRNWESQNGKVRFFYRLVMKKNTRIASGEVTLAALGQKCQKCPNSPYVAAKFVLDSIDDALQALFLKVKEKFYRENHHEEIADLEKRRRGETRGAHDSSRCQACELGICSFDANNSSNTRSRYTIRPYSGPTPANTRIQWFLRFGSKSSDSEVSSTVQNVSQMDAPTNWSRLNTANSTQSSPMNSSRVIEPNAKLSNESNSFQITLQRTNVGTVRLDANPWIATGSRFRQEPVTGTAGINRVERNPWTSNCTNRVLSSSGTNNGSATNRLENIHSESTCTACALDNYRRVSRPRMLPTPTTPPTPRRLPTPRRHPTPGGLSTPRTPPEPRTPPTPTTPPTPRRLSTPRRSPTPGRLSTPRTPPTPRSPLRSSSGVNRSVIVLSRSDSNSTISSRYQTRRQSIEKLPRAATMYFNTNHSTGSAYETTLHTRSYYNDQSRPGCQIL